MLETGIFTVMTLNGLNFLLATVIRENFYMTKKSNYTGVGLEHMRLY